MCRVDFTSEPITGGRQTGRNLAFVTHYTVGLDEYEYDIASPDTLERRRHVGRRRQ